MNEVGFVLVAGGVFLILVLQLVLLFSNPPPATGRRARSHVRYRFDMNKSPTHSSKRPQRLCLPA
jgi:hypothetical protein